MRRWPGIVIALNEIRGLILSWPLWLALIHHWSHH
jgi:hypothetical protein